MPRDIRLNDNGGLTFDEARASGLSGITMRAPAALAAPYSLTLFPALPAGPVFLTVDAAGQIGLSAGSVVQTLDAAYNGGSVITADAGPVEAAGAGGFLASHSAPVYGLETTGLERNYRLTAGQTAGILEIQVGDADGDISDDVFTVGLALDGTNRRLGLGTVAPATLAHFLAPAAVDAKLTIEAPLGLDASIIFNEGATARWEIGYDDSAGGLVVGRLSFANPAITVLDTNGDVGINEVSPEAKFHVTSTSGFVGLFESTSTEAAISMRDSATAGPLTVYVRSQGNDLQLAAGGNVFMHLDAADQRVGIGVTTPSAKLSVRSAVAAQVALLVDQDGNGDGLTIDSEATAMPLINLAPLSTNARGDIAFGTARTAEPATPSNGDVWYNATTERLSIAVASGLIRTIRSPYGLIFGERGATIRTISAGVVTAAHAGLLTLAAEAGTADQVDSISAADVAVGEVLLLRADTGDTITIAHDGVNIILDGSTNKVLDNNDLLMMIRIGTAWMQLTPLMSLA